MNKSSRGGRFVRQQAGTDGFSAFIPSPLPPVPPLNLSDGQEAIREAASHALGKLDGVARMLPDPGLLLYTYIRKEAVLSSQIEGTQSTLTELLEYESAEAPGAPNEDVLEVSNYVAALTHGLERIRQHELPLSLRLIGEMHAILLRGGRGGTKDPGRFRQSQNWIGGTRPGNARYVPPPAHEVVPALDNLEKFVRDSYGKTPPLLKAGFVHAQFETIHPFLDGNGRLGRLLIMLLLCSDQVLDHPLLYLSLHFKLHKEAYFESLQRVRTDGDWEGWFEFYLEGVRQVAEQAAETSMRIQRLFTEDHRRILTGKGAASGARMHELLSGRGVVSIPRAAKLLSVTQPTATAAIRRLEGLGIVREITGRQWGRQYVYSEYLKILNEGTE